MHRFAARTVMMFRRVLTGTIRPIHGHLHTTKCERLDNCNGAAYYRWYWRDEDQDICR